MASLILGLMLTVHSVLHNYFVTDVPKVTKGPGRVVTTNDFLKLLTTKRLIFFISD